MVRASFLLLALGCVLRLLFLDSDPYYYRWLGFISDEGRWVEHARRAALGGAWIESRAHNEHLLLSPSFSALSYLAFQIGGVSAAVARWVPAASGCLLLFLMTAFLRTRVPPAGVFLALAALAVQADFVLLSRVAVPEMPLALGALGVFCVLHGAERARPFRAGVLSAMMLSLKGTGFPLVPLFCFLAFAYPSGPLSLRDRERWRHAARFAAGVGAVGLVGILVLVGLAPGRVAGLSTDAGHILSFLRLPSFQTLATWPIYSSLSPVLNSTALAAWTIFLCALGRPRTDPAESATTRRLRRAAWAWLLVYPLQMLAMDYLPPRYQVHLLVPAAILYAASWTQMVSFRASALAAFLGGLEGLRGRALRGLLLMPSLVWCIPLLGLVALALDVPLDRVRFRFPFVVAALVGALGAAGWMRFDPSRIRSLIAFPWWCTTLWLGLFLLWPGSVPFWPGDGVEALALGALIAAAAALASPQLCLRLRPYAQHAPVAVGATLAVLWTLHLAPAFVSPHYQLRDLSRALGEELRGADLIMSASEGLFLDNTLRYSDPLDDPVDDRSGESYLVTAGGLPQPEEMERRYALSERYELMRQEDLRRPTPYVHTCKPSFGCGPVFELRIYRRATAPRSRAHADRDILSAPPH